MATARSINMVKNRLTMQSEVASKIEKNLSVNIIGKKKSPQETFSNNIKGTSGIRARKYFVGISQNE